MIITIDNASKIYRECISLPNNYKKYTIDEMCINEDNNELKIKEFTKERILEISSQLEDLKKKMLVEF